MDKAISFLPSRANNYLFMQLHTTNERGYGAIITCPVFVARARVVGSDITTLTFQTFIDPNGVIVMCPAQSKSAASCWIQYHDAHEYMTVVVYRFSRGG